MNNVVITAPGFKVGEKKDLFYCFVQMSTVHISGVEINESQLLFSICS